MSSERRKPILIIQHAEHEHAAALRRALESQGLQTLCIHPYRGEKHPGADEVSGVISLGGPMGANDEKDHPWIAAEVCLLRQTIDAKLPTVGICLGGQIMARALGGKVERNPIAEVGWFPIELNDEGVRDPILSGAGKSPTVYHWHEDTFIPPEGVVLLASSKHCARQAFRVSENAYAFQFHPEADHQLVHEWLSIEGVDDEIDGVRKIHGSRTVQNSKIQKNRAVKGEKASLKIVTAITSLFRKHPQAPLTQEMREDLQHWATRRRHITVQIEGSNRKPMHIDGRIVSLLSIPAGEFVIIQEASSLLWPIRADDIQEIKIAR
jgi:GMP synthase (glutamine-hydrolysing)